MWKYSQNIQYFLAYFEKYETLVLLIFKINFIIQNMKGGGFFAFQNYEKKYFYSFYTVYYV